MRNEYLKRNLLVAQAIGINAGLAAAIKRLESHSKQPKWLIELLKREHEKAGALPKALAKYRDLANPNTGRG